MRSNDEPATAGRRPTTRPPWFLPRFAAAAAIGLGSLACVRGPGAAALAVDTGAPVAIVKEASAPLSEAEVEPLELEGVKGGQLTFEVDGDPEDVLEMLLDFDHAEGNRAWAKHYELLERDGDVVTARWSFQGRMGIDPRTEMELRIERLPDELVVTYRLSKPAFGLAAFFGDYRIRPAAAPSASILTERVYIDSGIPIANASRKDIADGLKEDARLIVAWMQERTAGPSAPPGDGLDQGAPQR